MSDRIKDLNNPSPWNMRIWDEAKHQWLCDGEDDVLPYYGFDIRGGEVTAFQGIDWIYKQHKRWNDFIWERSTGLTDKNGKEIYEGDVVKGEMGVFEVRWYDAIASFCFKPNMDMKWHPNCNQGTTDYMEVIGNIHEKDKLVDFDHVKGGEE